MRYGDLTKNKIILSLFIIFIAAAVLYVFLIGNDKKAVRETANIYIEAVRDRNFDMVYNLNASSQKRRLFALKSSNSNNSELIRQTYEGQKASFDSAQPSFDFNAIWVEKFIFIPGMKYTIAEVAMERNADNPTSFYRKRIDAAVEVEVEYEKKGAAPQYDGKNIRKAVYLIKMIHSKNLARTVKGIVIDDKWLFKGITVKEGSVVYWE